MEIKNAVIESSMLGYEGHGILSAFIHLNFGGMGQGFGGFALDGPWNKEENRRMDSADCGIWVRGVLKVAGVEKWEDLKGRPVRAGGSYSRIDGLGHYLEDKWFFYNKKAGRWVIGEGAEMESSQ